MKEIRTINGKFDARCRLCSKAAFRLWIDDTPPPSGCGEGHDDDISKCGHVYNALVAIVIGLDYLKRELRPEEDFLLGQLGEAGERLMVDIRAGKEPPRNEPREPRYDAPRGVH